MPFYRKRPVIIDANQWTGVNGELLVAWMGEDNIYFDFDGTAIYVAANDAWLNIEVGEWVIKDSLGFYPCKDEKFHETYERM